jgi:Arc/MetJ family transcription regulator
MERLPFAHAEKERARQALNVMHDHISRMFPGACPMTDPAPVQAPPIPPTEGLSKSDEPEVVKDVVTETENAFKLEVSDDDLIKGARKKLAKKVLSGKMTVDEARAKLGRMRAQKSSKSEDEVKALFESKTISRAEALKMLGYEPEPEVVKSAAPDAVRSEATATSLDAQDSANQTITPEMIESAVSKAVAPLLEKLAGAEHQISKQQEALDAIADLPDPSTAAFAGIAVKKGARPAGVPSQAEIAERTQSMMIRSLEHTYRSSENPAEREAAYQALHKFQG